MTTRHNSAATCCQSLPLLHNPLKVVVKLFHQLLFSSLVMKRVLACQKGPFRYAKLQDMHNPPHAQVTTLQDCKAPGYQANKIVTKDPSNSVCRNPASR